MKLIKKQMMASLCVLLVVTITACSTQQSNSQIQSQNKNTEQMEEKTMTEYYTFELSSNVTRTSVSYTNRFGITLAGDLYTPANLDSNGQYPALVIGPPYGGVKEQGPGVYANQLAQRGFIVLSFDPSFNGYSKGETRHISSPEFFVEDFSAGVDFLGTQAFVDREKIGVVGICGSGSFAITAAQVDTRIKAVATTSMYDISRNIRNGFEDSMTDKERIELLNMLSQKRWQDFENGKPEFNAAFPPAPLENIPDGLDPISEEFFSYYGLKRGHHPNAVGGFTTTSMLSFMNFPLMNYIETISPRPILFIVGEEAHSRYFSEDAYKMAAEPKELYIVPNSNHVDLYDQLDKIPFEKMESFFMEAFQ